MGLINIIISIAALAVVLGLIPTISKELINGFEFPRKG